MRWWRLVGGVALVAVLVFVAVAVASIVVARRVAEQEAVNDATTITNVVAGSVMQPALQDDLLSTDAAAAAAARAGLDATIRPRLRPAGLVRVKLWSADGRVVYSDEPRLIGQVFALEADERGALTSRENKAEVSDLSRPENRFERSAQGKLLEVYRPVWTPDHTPLLFETYSRYDVVTARSSQLWRGFGGITLTSLLLLLVAQAPLTWALVSRVRRAQDERAALLQRSVEASEDERRRIAATLHDGVVQELAASAFLVAGAADRVRGTDGPAAVPISEQLDDAARAVRSGIGGLRSLLVDIYPPSLRSAGLVAALGDLAAPLRSRGVAVTLDLPAEGQLPALPGSVEALVFRVAQECLRNVVAHAEASHVHLALRPAVEGAPVVLEIADDGRGFDAERVLAEPPAGHFGMRLMGDLATSAGARLMVASAPEAGTRWRLEVPA